MRQEIEIAKEHVSCDQILSLFRARFLLLGLLPGYVSKGRGREALVLLISVPKVAISSLYFCFLEDVLFGL